MHQITFTLSKDYYSECFEQSIRYANRWRKYARIAAILFILLGGFLILNSNHHNTLAYFLIAIGIYETMSPIIKKPIWVRKHVKSKLFNTAIDVFIDDKGIETKGKHSEGQVSWQGIERFLETPKGVFIWPQKGVHMYFPKSTMNDDILQFLHEKCA